MSLVLPGGKMVPFDFNQRIALPQNVLYKDLNGEAVLLNLSTETYFGLDEVGNRMISVLVSSESIEAAYRTLLEEYEVNPETLRSDLLSFIENLIKEGLIYVVR